MLVDLPMRNLAVLMVVAVVVAALGLCGRERAVPASGRPADAAGGGGSDEAGSRSVVVGMDRTEVERGSGRERPSIVELQGDAVLGRTLRVLAVSAAGAPAPGVPIALRVGDGRRRIGVTSAVDGVLAVALPAARGAAFAEVFADVIGFEPAGVVVDLRALPREVLRVPVPPVGRLRIEVVGSGGTPEAGARVVVEPAFGRRGAGARGSCDSGGSLVIPTVAVGARLELHVATDGRGVTREVRGPGRSGTEAVLRVVLDAAIVELVGRALDEGGEPCGGIGLQLRYVGRSAGGARAVTGVDGRFRFELPATEAGGGWEFAEVHALDAEGRLAWRSARLAAVRLELGENVVGDVALTTTPVPVAGRFVPPPESASGVRVAVEREVDGPEGLRWVAVEGVGAAFVRVTGFELRGEVPPGRLRLRVDARGYLPVGPIPFEAGRRDLVVRLDRGGTVSATFVLPESSTPVVTLRGADRERRPPTEARRGEVGVLECRWSGLRAGRYEVEVHGGGRLLWSAADIAVPADGRAVDPRVDRVDLRGLR